MINGSVELLDRAAACLVFALPAGGRFWKAHVCAGGSNGVVSGHHLEESDNRQQENTDFHLRKRIAKIELLNYFLCH